MVSQKGYKATAETRRKMSEAKMGVKRGPLTEQHKQRISAGRTGQKPSAAVRANMSEGQKRRAPFTAEHCQRISDAKRGVPWSANHRRKRAEKSK